MVLLGVDKTVKWCNSFVIVAKPNCTLCICLDPALLNWVLKRPTHRGPTVRYIVLKKMNVCYLTLIDIRSDYHNLKLDKTIIISDHIYMSIWQLQIHETSIQCSLSR